jgi:hypothetical protein
MSEATHDPLFFSFLSFFFHLNLRGPISSRPANVQLLTYVAAVSTASLRTRRPEGRELLLARGGSRRARLSGAAHTWGDMSGRQAAALAVHARGGRQAAVGHAGGSVRGLLLLRLYSASDANACQAASHGQLLLRAHHVGELGRHVTVTPA